VGTGAAIEDDQRAVIAPHLNTRRVAAVAQRGSTRLGQGSAGTPKPDIHPCTLTYKSTIQLRRSFDPALGLKSRTIEQRYHNLTQGCLMLIDTTVSAVGLPSNRTESAFGPCKRDGHFFGRRSAANSNANGEHQNPSWSPSWGMSIRIVERNSLLNLAFSFARHLRSCGTLRLKYHRKQPSKNNNDDSQN
jgi:hypothetical protein